VFQLQGNDKAYKEQKKELRNRLKGLKVLKFEDKQTPAGVNLKLLRENIFKSTQAQVCCYLKKPKNSVVLVMLQKDADEFEKVQKVYAEYKLTMSEDLQNLSVKAGSSDSEQSESLGISYKGKKL
jgi:hypothetical protein